MGFFLHSKPNVGVSRVDAVEKYNHVLSEINKKCHQHIGDKIKFQSLENFPTTVFHDAP